MIPALYVVATPIGNLEDITLRGIRVLREVGLIAAEDTRKTKRLLNKYEIRTPLTSYHEHNKLSKLNELLAILREKDIALVSEAGTPGMSDPGYELVRAAGQQGIPVIPVPGPSAVISALTVSGLPTDRFLFCGFLPNRQSARQRALREIAAESATLVILEAPHRLIASLEDIRLVLGDRELAVCREMTKLHEELFRGTISEAIARFTAPRGELTLVIAGQKAAEPPQLTGEITRQLRDMYLAGATAREAIARVSRDTGLPRKELYRTWLQFPESRGQDKDLCHLTGRR
ncbi:MAG: 16S rRNA (cytidine(1402)-2'-O)-methyltransferase [Chloroflexota bacterium]